jgi:peroxiredoxin
MFRFLRANTNQQNPEPGYPAQALPPGTRAPDFRLPGGDGQRHSLRDLRGRPVVLAFYPADWSPVCGDQLALYSEALSLFEEHQAQLVGLSVDSHWSHRAYSESRRLRFPLLADFEPKGEVARMYGVYNPERGTARRALFVIDGQGVIRWSQVSPDDVNPGAHGILMALENLSDGTR